MTRIVVATLSVLLTVVSGCTVDSGGEQDASEIPTAGETLPLGDAVSVDISTRAGHCVASVSGGATSCFSTFTESLRFATLGRISDAPADSRVAMSDVKLAERINALATRTPTTKKNPLEALQGNVQANDSVVIGIEYLNSGYAGSSYVWTAGSACDGNTSTNEFWVSDLRAVGWNDVISSFHSYSSCTTVLYEDLNFGGASTNGGAPIADMSFVGLAMNDRATSIKWF
jgi:hypothetical protein